MAAVGSATVSAQEAASLESMNPKQVFGHVMGELAEKDPNLAVVVSDYGRRLNLEHMREVMPDAYVQCGIAEQNQVEVASALANEGFTTFAPCYATFITSRVLDQVRVNLGMMRSPVTLVGVSCGCESGMLGASHMALEDISCMRAIPGLSVFGPADKVELAAVLRELAANPRPAYVRTNELDGTCLHASGTTFVPGRAERLFVPVGAAPEVAIVATGTIASRAVEAARALGERGIAAEVLEFATIKPLDTSALDAIAASGVRLVVTLEEHSVVGGLGGAVAEHLAETGGVAGTSTICAGANQLAPAPTLLRLGMPDEYLEADTQQNLLARASLTVEDIARRIAERL